MPDIYVETSALVSLLLEEPGAQHLLDQLYTGEGLKISVVSAVEAAMVVGKVLQDHPLATQLTYEFLHRMRVEVVALPAEVYDDALKAYARYGRGTGHRARLDLGDCFSYAFAKRYNLVMLAKGNNFIHTDLMLA